MEIQGDRVQLDGIVCMCSSVSYEVNDIVEMPRLHVGENLGDIAMPSSMMASTG
jgi:hypothetical protein